MIEIKKILLIYGGNSNEHEISCKSAQFIINNIDKNKYQLDCVKITKKNDWIMKNQKILDIITLIKSYDVVFPIIHGKNGEDGKIQGMMDLFGIKYVGSKNGPSYIGMDKERTKQIISLYNIPQIPYKTYDKKEKNIQYPVIVKPANSGSSIGINVATNKKELTKAIKKAKKHDTKIILENFINAQELECAIIEDNKKIIVSDIGEIISASKFYDYDAKYKNNDSKTIIPANIDNHLNYLIKEYAKKIFKVLELSNLARIDFLYDKDNNKIYFNEVNTIPGFTEISMYPKLIENKGISYKSLITILIENAKKSI